MAHEGRKSEDEWFARHEKDLMRNLRVDRERKQKELDALMQKEEARKQKELHWMKCPKCGAGLYEQNLLGIRVDVCPICDSIHFDNDELQDLVLKSQQERREILFRILGVSSVEEGSNAEALYSVLKQQREFKEKELAWLLDQGEARPRKELHFMKCPKCGSNLKEEDFQDLKGDICSVCGGINLARLEIQRLLVRQTDVRKTVLQRMFGIFDKS